MRIGGLTLSVESTTPSLRLDVSPCNRSFVATDAVPDVRLSARWGSIAVAPEETIVFDSQATWRLHASDHGYVYQFFDPSFGETPYKEARIDLDVTRGDLTLDPAAFPSDTAVDPLEFPLDELLVLRMLALGGGVELHACGVVSPSGEGYIFTGQSGDGKTTTARLWETIPGTTILSDDRIIVRRRENGSWWMHGTPWHGEAALAANVSAPVRAIMLLERGSSSALIRTEPMEAVAGLLARSFVPFHDSDSMDSVLDALGDLVLSVPCFRFPFVPDSEAVRFVLDNAPRDRA